MNLELALEFKEDDHTYWVCGRRVPSVTEVLKSVGLMPGLEFVSDEAVMQGIRVHRMIHFYNKGTLDMKTVTDDLAPYLQEYQRFEMATGFIAEEWEKRVHNPAVWVAGTFDVRGTLAYGGSAIIDLKSGFVKPWTKLQLAGYRRCCNSQVYERLFSLSLKEGKPCMQEYLEPNLDGLFMAAVSIHNFKLNNKIKI